MLDLLSDILTRLDLRGTLYFRTSLTPPWGIEVPRYENVARFHYAHRGECLVQVSPDGAPLRLAQGDLVIVPHGASHRLFCQSTAPQDVLPLDDVLQRSGYDGEGVLVYGGGDETMETQLICGHFSFAPGARHVIFDRLPQVIHIPGYGDTAGAWMEASLRLIGLESAGTRLGGDLVSLKLSEAIFAQAIRHHIELQAAGSGALAGFADPHLSRALAAFHRDPAAQWTVEQLARTAGMSRTGFAQTFADKIGQTPMQYLTAWRMQVARRGLVERRMNVADAAELAGYASEAAFSRVFKREVGQSPAAYRAAHMTS